MEGRLGMGSHFTIGIKAMLSSTSARGDAGQIKNTPQPQHYYFDPISADESDSQQMTRQFQLMKVTPTR